MKDMSGQRCPHCQIGTLKKLEHGGGIKFQCDECCQSSNQFTIREFSSAMSRRRYETKNYTEFVRPK